MSLNGGGGGGGPPPFLIPPPPPPPPPAHLQAAIQQHVTANNLVIKSEPSEHFIEHSSHDEILNSEFGQAAREAAPSGRTVLGNFKVAYSSRLALIQQLLESF